MSHSRPLSSVTAWLHVLQLAMLYLTSCFFPRLKCTFTVIVPQSLGLGGLRSCRKICLSSDHMSTRSLRGTAFLLTCSNYTVRVAHCFWVLSVRCMGNWLSCVLACDKLTSGMLTMWRDDSSSPHDELTGSRKYTSHLFPMVPLK